MADVFLSYSQKDRVHAERLAERLEEGGFSVWWDRTLLIGEDYAPEIERQLKMARCVIVLWSAASVASQWVRDEADEAKRSNAYLPVMIDGTEPPLGFRAAERGDLTDWDGAPDDAEFQRLVRSIRRYVGGEAPPEPSVLGIRSRLAGVLRSRRARVRAAVAVLLIAALAFGILPAARRARPVRIDLSAIVPVATLTFGRVISEGLLSSARTPALTVMGFESADFGFGAIDPPVAQLAPGALLLSAADPYAAVAFRDVTLSGLRVEENARFAWSWRSGIFDVTALDSRFDVHFTAPARLQFECEGCKAASGGGPPVELPSSPQAIVLDRPRVVPIRAGAPGMSITLEVPPDTVLFEANVPLENVEFTDAGDDRRVASSILSGSIAYPQLRRPVRPLARGEIVVMDGLEDFYLKEVAVAQDGLRLGMEGQVSRLDVGTAGNVVSLLPTTLEDARARSPWLLYGGAAIVAAVVAAFVAVRRRPRR